jgi:hypothetical protein
VPETLILPLRNNLLLTISGQPTLRALAGFLSAAIIHFKNQQDIQQVALYTAGSFQGRVGANDCAISHPGDTTSHYLAPTAWLEALRDVHGRIDGLEQMRVNIPLFRKQGSGARLGHTLSPPRAPPFGRTDASRLMLRSAAIPPGLRIRSWRTFWQAQRFDVADLVAPTCRIRIPKSRVTHGC